MVLKEVLMAFDERSGGRWLVLVMLGLVGVALSWLVLLPRIVRRNREVLFNRGWSKKFLTTYNHVAFPRRVQFLTYKVKRGETIQHVARHFGIKA